jgi:hypothetical protein
MELIKVIHVGLRTAKKKTKSTNLRNNVRDTSNDFERDTYEFDRVEEYKNKV